MSVSRTDVYFQYNALRQNPASSVPQGCYAVKTRLTRVSIPLKPAPGHNSSAKQNVSRAHGFSNVMDFEKVYNNDDITFAQALVETLTATRFGLQHIITHELGKR